MREGEPNVNGTLRIWNQIGRATGAQAISLRILEFAPGTSPGLLNAESDEILYVLGSWERGRPVRTDDGDSRVSGQVRPARLLINDAPYEIDVDTGIYVRPGQSFAIENPAPDSLALVSCRCPEPESPQEFVTTPSSESSPQRSPLVRLADRPAQPTADRWYRVLVDDEVGSTQATQFVGSIPPGRAPDHFHQYEEVLFILQGQGRMWAGETSTPIEPGSCIYLPKGQVHCVENSGTGELRLLGVFYPAGSPSVRYDA
jgi:mannose-6-phosphate isomerase-like protein (cupin superfamily)